MCDQKKKHLHSFPLLSFAVLSHGLVGIVNSRVVVEPPKVLVAEEVCASYILTPPVFQVESKHDKQLTKHNKNMKRHTRP